MEIFKYGMGNNSYFSSTILSWFRENGRELPWRDTRDPYAIWLSEIILQQTRIAQGWEYWERFMKEFPTVEQLASASEDEVLKLWQGLGYYSRARNLHAAARQIVEMGRFPDTLKDIRSLKGVGDYTAAAIASFAFDIPAAVVDGNVYRVLSRYFGISTPIDTTQGKKEFAALAQSLLPAPDASAYNQGMMDFGATQCTPQSPRCLLCPLAETCEALRCGRVNELPVKSKALKVKTRYLSFVYIRHQGYVALHRRPAGDIWQGLWEPFLIESTESVDSGSVAVPIMEIRHRLLLTSTDRLLPLARGVRHVLTHRILLADFFLLDTNHRPPLPEGYKWIPEKDLDQYAVPRLVEIMYSFIKL